MRRLPSLSSLSRAMACRASAVYPGAESISADAEGGTVMHAFLERVNVLQVPAADGAALSREAAVAKAIEEAPEDERPFLSAIPIEELPTDPKAFAAEVALAFDVVTGKGRELGRGIGRRYEEAAAAQGKPLAATEFVGSLDVAALMGSDGVLVTDWKKRGRYVKRARDNWQIKGALVMAARTWGRTRGRGQVTRIFDDGRDPYHDRHDFAPADIDAAQVEMTHLAIRILGDRKAFARGEEVPATTGEHCRYCPAFQRCPANLTLARRVASDAPAVQGEVLVSRETAPQVVRFLEQLEALKAAIGGALDTLASQAAADGQPIEMGDGTIYAPVARPRESIDGEKAKPILESELGTFASEALGVDVSKAGIKAGVRKKLAAVGVSRGLSKVEEEILEKLRKAGAVKRSVTYSCAVTTPGKAALAARKDEAA